MNIVIDKNTDWYYISICQKLSEEFIKEFQDKVYWNYISQYQKLSEEFIKEFQDNVDWNCISIYQKLSEEFIKEFNLSIPDNNWLYISLEDKRKAILSCGLYEIDNEDNIIAYKGCRNDGYSKYNFQYHYEVGNTYYSHADYDIENENSFGLSAWTLEKAKEYCNDKIFKIKCPLVKIAALVHNGYKLRCEEITIVEEIQE